MPELRIAPPLNRQEIEDAAWHARAALGLLPFERAPMAQIIENVLPELIHDFYVRVVDTAALLGAEAVTDAAKPVITFGLSEYQNLLRDQPRARMTAAHELGHLLLHTGQTSYAFMRKRNPWLDPERQADIFAEAFLMPECAFRRMGSIVEAMQTFGVSKDAATFRARKLRMWNLIGGKAPSRRSKKKGCDKRRTP